MAVINHCLPTQNGIWVKIYHFWPKNDDAKGSRKIFLKFLHAQTHFQTLLFTPEKEGFGTKMTNSVTKMTFFKHGGISKKTLWCMSK